VDAASRLELIRELCSFEPRGAANDAERRAANFLVGRIEKLTKSRMEQGEIPSRREVAGLKVSKLREKFLAVENADRIIRAFLASEPDPDASLAYLESGNMPVRLLRRVFEHQGLLPAAA